MAPKKELSLNQRVAILALRNVGFSLRAIANQVGCSRNGVAYNLKRFSETNYGKNRSGRTGRPGKLTPAAKRQIKITALKNRRMVLREHVECVRACMKDPVSPNTVRKALHQMGLYGRMAAKKPLLRTRNRRARLLWARAHVNWTPEQWNRVLWTDESQFMLFGTNKRFYIRRRTGEKYLDACLHPTMKHGGGSVMVWGGFCGAGTSPLKLIEGRMDKFAYKQILIHHGLKAGKKLLGKGFVFQQDNDPKHKSHLCMNYLQGKERDGLLKIMDWPAQSPDLNPIEQLWALLDHKIQKLRASNVFKLFAQLNEEWKSISTDVLSKYVLSMNSRCRAVIKAKGGHTKY